MRRLTVAAGALSWAVFSAGCTDDCEFGSDTAPSCEEDTCTPTPDDCSGEIPGTASLKVVLSTPLPRLVRIYRGAAYETGQLVDARAPLAKEFSVLLPLGTYSVTALYVTGTDSVLAVNRGTLDYYELDTCTTICYETDPGVVDLALQ